MPYGRFFPVLASFAALSCGAATPPATGPARPSVAASAPVRVVSGETHVSRIVAISGDLKEGVCVVRDDFRATCWGSYDGWTDIVEPYVEANRFRDISVNEGGLCGLFADWSAGCIGQRDGRHGWRTEMFRDIGPFAILGQSRKTLQLCAIEARMLRPYCWVGNSPSEIVAFASVSHRAISHGFGLDSSGKILTSQPIPRGRSEQLDLCKPKPCTKVYRIDQGVCGADVSGTATCISTDRKRVDVFLPVDHERHVGACGGSRCCQAGPGFVRCREVFSTLWTRAGVRDGNPTLMSVGSGGVCVAFDSGEVECTNFSDLVVEP